MLRFSANISMLFTELPLLDRPLATADAGFDAFEIQFPYDIPIDDLRKAKETAKLDVAVFNLPVGDFINGGIGLAAIPGREAHFRAGVAEAIIYAEALKPLAVNVLAGSPYQYMNKKICLKTLANNLNYAAHKFETIGVSVLCEAINNEDRPGYLISDTAEAIAIINQANHKNLALLCDIYQMYKMDKDPLQSLELFVERVGHIQFADVPGRNEPGTGKLDFDAIFSKIEKLGYSGWIGAEYNPQTSTRSSLNWLRKYSCPSTSITSLEKI